jgi:hypothetical protein
MVEVDTLHRQGPVDGVKIGPENMSSSRSGVGLIRDEAGKLVFS